MKQTISFILLLFIFFLTSCTSLPGNQNKDSSFLIIPIERQSIQKDELFVYYELNGKIFSEDKDFSITVNPINNFKQVNNMKPGLYSISSYNSVYYKSNKKGKRGRTSIGFELQENTVTIAPKKVVVYVERKDHGSTQYVRFENLNDDDYQKCEKYIKSQKMYDQLKIMR